VTEPFQTDIAQLRDRETCPYIDKKKETTNGLTVEGLSYMRMEGWRQRRLGSMGTIWKKKK
jgi:hypothetical protein